MHWAGMGARAMRVLRNVFFERYHYVLAGVRVPPHQGFGFIQRM
jgi:hypothetical protein